MPKTIKVGGLNASAREESAKSETETTKKTTRKTSKKTTDKKPATKKTTKKKVEKEIDDPVVKEGISPDMGSKEVANDSTSNNTNNILDLSEFGEGMFAEIDPSKLENNPIPENTNIEETPVEDTPSTNTEEEVDPKILSAGNTKCYGFLSLKATGLHNPDIISFAIITDEGKAFYAEMKDIDIMKITPNILSTVIHRRFNLTSDDITDTRVAVTGDNDHIRGELFKWIKEEYTDKGHILQIVSDKVLNEFTLFMDFLTNGIPVENYLNMISPVCVDINSILSESIDTYRGDMSVEEFVQNYIPAYIASGIPRLTILDDPSIPKDYIGNALVNAQVIRRVFMKLYGINDEGKEDENK